MPPNQGPSLTELLLTLFQLTIICCRLQYYYINRFLSLQSVPSINLRITTECYLGAYSMCLSYHKIQINSSECVTWDVHKKFDDTVNRLFLQSIISMSVYIILMGKHFPRFGPHLSHAQYSTTE